MTIITVRTSPESTERSGVAAVPAANDCIHLSVPLRERVKADLSLDHPVMNSAFTELKNSWMVLQTHATAYTDAIARASNLDLPLLQNAVEEHLSNHRAIYDLSKNFLRQLDSLSPFLARLDLSTAHGDNLRDDLLSDKRANPEHLLSDSQKRMEELLTKSFNANTGQTESVQKYFESTLGELRALFVEINNLLAFEQQQTAKLGGSDGHYTTIQPLFFHNPALYKKISESMHRVHYHGDAPQVSIEGLTLTPHPPDRIQSMVDKGARIITHSASNGEIVGHCIFFNPDKAPAQAPEFVKNLEAYSPVGFLHVIQVEADKAKGTDAYRKMLLATLTGLQYSDAKYVAGAVHQDNWRALATHLVLGSASLVGSSELTRLNERFFACVLPVDPAIRRESPVRPMSNRRIVAEIQQKRLPGLFPQNWQRSAEVWQKNYRIFQFVSTRLETESYGHQRVNYERQLRDLRYEMQGFETRINMIEGGRNILSCLRKNEPVPQELWQQLARGRLANNGNELSMDQMVKILDYARDPSLVRITGGCGLMEASHWKGMLRLFRDSFAGFGGAILVGGTRMLVEENGQPTSTIKPGITEIPMVLRRACPDAVIGGLVLGTERYNVGEKTVLFDRQPWSLGQRYAEQNKFTTILNPEIEYFMYVDHANLPGNRKWDAEYQDAISIAKTMCTSERPGLRKFDPLLVVYNGGGTTEREVRAWCDLKWPVMLIEGSGRIADTLAHDASFLAENKNVFTVDRDAELINLMLQARGIIPAQD